MANPRIVMERRRKRIAMGLPPLTKFEMYVENGCVIIFLLWIVLVFAKLFCAAFFNVW